MDELSKQAISAALSGNWQEACEYNELILKSSSDNVDAIVRLGKAYLELGEKDKSKKFLDRAIKLDPLNPIASKLLSKIKAAKAVGEITHTKVTPEMFLEEPGRTKITHLTHLGDSNVLIQLDPGDEVKLNTSGHTISVSTQNDKHIGRIPDALGFKIKKLVLAGFSYQALVKSANQEDVKVFLRETERPLKSKGMTSFPIERVDLGELPQYVDDSDED